MNSQSNAIPESSVEAHAIATAATSNTQLFYWSVRREFWENRSIYIAPLAVAVFTLLAFSFSAIAGIWESRLRLNPARPQSPYDMAAGLMMLTLIIVSVFYCLDALHGERRDRSILFWKSLPVSDLITVLAKASIPLLLLPLLVFAVTVAMQWMMLLVSTAVVMASGQSVSMLWTKLPLARMSLLLLYHLVTAHLLWPAPMYCWLLLVSGWARRATFLWAVLPLIALAAVEKIAFNSLHFAALLASRIIGGGAPTNAMLARDVFPTDPMTHITPDKFLSSPGLWIGLIVAALFLAAAVRVRRYQGPI
jgi:ABC-2 type transport system permease protein